MKQAEAVFTKRKTTKTLDGKFNLLNGVFTGSEAKEILVTLFSDKIRFHSLNNFSHEERFGAPDPHAMERIPVLRKTLEDVLVLLGENGEEQKFEVYADIKIKAIE